MWMESLNAWMYLYKQLLETSFSTQINRLKYAGYSTNVLQSMSEIKTSRAQKQNNHSCFLDEGLLLFFTYMSHNKIKVAVKAKVTVTFSTSKNQSGKCKKVNQEESKKQPCSKKPTERFIEYCTRWCMRLILLMCSHCYAGQMAICINDRLRKHVALLKQSTYNQFTN